MLSHGQVFITVTDIISSMITNSELHPSSKWTGISGVGSHSCSLDYSREAQTLRRAKQTEQGCENGTGPVSVSQRVYRLAARSSSRWSLGLDWNRSGSNSQCGLAALGCKCIDAIICKHSITYQSPAFKTLPQIKMQKYNQRNVLKVKVLF